MIETSELTVSNGTRFIFDLRRDSVVVIPKLDDPFRVTLDEFEIAMKTVIDKRKKKERDSIG